MVQSAPSAKLVRLVEVLRARATRPGDTVAEQRATFEAAIAEKSLPEGVTVTPTKVGSVKGEYILPPRPAANRTILYLHGGGYVIGSLNTIRPLASYLAVAAAARVLTIDYRLAPEHTFPAAVDDSTEVFCELLSSGCNPKDLVIAGDSAGGGLAVSTLVALRDRSLPMPAAAVCLSPWADLSMSGVSIDANASRDPQVQRWLLAEMAALYLGDEDPVAPLASPQFADLSGLPPLLIHAGTAEALIDDATALARRASEAGVSVTFEAWPHMIHVWHAFAPDLPEATAALRRIGEWLTDTWCS